MKKLTSFFAALLLLVASTAGVQASDNGWDMTDKEQVFITLQSRIMEIDHNKNRLVVAEREIELVNEREKGKELSTMLRNSYGGKILWGALSRGNTVFIRGFEQSGGPILAREIYLLESGSQATNLSFQKTVPDWNWTAIESK